MELTGKELQNILQTELGKHEKGIIDYLQPFEPKGTFNNWIQIIRSIDEMINIIFFEIENGSDYDYLTSISLDFSTFEGVEVMSGITNILTKRFNKNTAERFVKLTLMTVAISHAFKINTQDDYGHGLNLNTIGEAAIYYQSRRGHLMTFLYLIPTYCKGSKTLQTIECLNYFLPQLEHSLVGITTINQQLLLSEVFNDYRISVNNGKMRGNYQFNDLERIFLEPERVSIIDQHEHRGYDLNNKCLNKIDRKKVLSIQELKCFIEMIESAYSVYGIKETIYSEYKTVILDILNIQKSDYHISITTKDLRKILKRANKNSQSTIRESLIFNKANNFYHASTARSPFIKVRGNYVSTVILINGFMNEIKNLSLKNNKRYQINSGFIFEDMVKKILVENGFFVTDITRINRKEFDVVTVRDNEIYNFQCKNSFLDLKLLYTEKKQLIKYNRRLIAYYKRALKKEKDRESLVKNKLEINEIHHFVVSRFPVISNNDSIINFNALEKWIDNHFSIKKDA